MNSTMVNKIGFPVVI